MISTRPSENLRVSSFYFIFFKWATDVALKYKERPYYTNNIRVQTWVLNEVIIEKTFKFKCFKDRKHEI